MNPGTSKWALGASDHARQRGFGARLIEFGCGPWHRLDHLYTAAMADIRQSRRQRGVGDEGLDLAEMGDADRRAAPKFGAVGNQHHAARIRDDGLGRLHLAIVKIQQRSLLVDGGSADDGVVDLELTYQADSGRADYRAIGA